MGQPASSKSPVKQGNLDEFLKKSDGNGKTKTNAPGEAGKSSSAGKHQLGRAKSQVASKEVDPGSIDFDMEHFPFTPKGSPKKTPASSSNVKFSPPARTSS